MPDLRQRVLSVLDRLVEAGEGELIVVIADCREPVLQVGGLHAACRDDRCEHRLIEFGGAPALEVADLGAERAELHEQPRQLHAQHGRARTAAVQAHNVRRAGGARQLCQRRRHKLGRRRRRLLLRGGVCGIHLRLVR